MHTVAALEPLSTHCFAPTRSEEGAGTTWPQPLERANVRFVAALPELNSAERLEWEHTRLPAAKAGDQGAWSDLYQAYADLIFSRVLMPKLGNPSAAEDALSETFRTAVERIDQFQPRGASIYFWLARIASNKAMDLHRARGVTGRALVNVQTQLLPLLDSPLTPDDALDCKKQFLTLGQRLQEALSELNPRYRRAIELRFFEELSRERCAELMEVRLGTYDVLLLRALKALRKHWERQVADAKESGRVETE